MKLSVFTFHFAVYWHCSQQTYHHTWVGFSRAYQFGHVEYRKVWVVITPTTGRIQGSLSKLRVINAKLNSIPDTYFSGCNKLSELKLSHNHLRVLPDLSVISATLDLIDLNHNDLTDVRSLQDFSFPNLQYVYLDHNKIQQVDIRRFHLPRLHDMILSHNLLQEFGHPKSLVRGGDRGDGPRAVKVRLQLNGNPWYCNSGLSWIASPYKSGIITPVL